MMLSKASSSASRLVLRGSVSSSSSIAAASHAGRRLASTSARVIKSSDEASTAASSSTPSTTLSLRNETRSFHSGREHHLDHLQEMRELNLERSIKAKQILNTHLASKQYRPLPSSTSTSKATESLWRSQSFTWRSTGHPVGLSPFYFSRNEPPILGEQEGSKNGFATWSMRQRFNAAASSNRGLPVIYNPVQSALFSSNAGGQPGQDLQHYIQRRRGPNRWGKLAIFFGLGLAAERYFLQGWWFGSSKHDEEPKAPRPTTVELPAPIEATTEVVMPPIGFARLADSESMPMWSSSKVLSSNCDLNLVSRAADINFEVNVHNLKDTLLAYGADADLQEELIPITEVFTSLQTLSPDGIVSVALIKERLLEVDQSNDLFDGLLEDVWRILATTLREAGVMEALSHAAPPLNLSSVLMGGGQLIGQALSTLSIRTLAYFREQSRLNRLREARQAQAGDADLAQRRAREWAWWRMRITGVLLHQHQALMVVAFVQYMHLPAAVNGGIGAAAGAFGGHFDAEY